DAEVAGGQTWATVAEQGVRRRSDADDRAAADQFQQFPDQDEVAVRRGFGQFATDPVAEQCQQEQRADESRASLVRSHGQSVPVASGGALRSKVDTLAPTLVGTGRGRAALSWPA